jgi:hypothetical protein
MKFAIRDAKNVRHALILPQGFRGGVDPPPLIRGK